MMTEHGDLNARLDALLRAYRAACPDPEPGANFMPGIWQKIEARQSYSFFLGRMARAFVTAAVAISFAMAAYVFLPGSHPSAFYSETYVEALANSHAADSQDFYEPVALDTTNAGTEAR